MTYSDFESEMACLQLEENELEERLESIRRRRESLENIALINEWE